MRAETKFKADGFELVEDYDIRSRRTGRLVEAECGQLERWYPGCEFELRFAWGFSFGRPGATPGVVPQIQIWTRRKGDAR